MDLYNTEMPLVIYLKPGDMYIAERPAVVSTVLGSCVAVTMFNLNLRIGAICHAILPICMHKDNCSDNVREYIYKKKRNGGCQDPYRYVDCSIYNMLRQFEMFNVKRDKIEIKLFGGSDMFTSLNKGTGILTVGVQNIEKALKIIEAEDLKLCKSDIGGVQGRKIFFYTYSGEVLLKRLKKSGH